MIKKVMDAMVPLRMTFITCDDNTKHHMPTVAIMMSHDQRGQVQPHFYHFDLMNAVPLTMLLVLCNLYANGIT